MWSLKVIKDYPNILADLSGIITNDPICMVKQYYSIVVAWEDKELHLLG